jgi:hypothetical protein
MYSNLYVLLIFLWSIKLMMKLNVKAALTISAVLMSGSSATNAASHSRYFVERGIEAKAVFMESGDFIQMIPNQEDQNKKSIFSFGFGGCTGTVLYVLLKNGEQRAALTHYPPTSTAAHLSKIHGLSNALKHGISCDDIVKVAGIIFHEGNWARNPNTGDYTDRVPCDAKLVDRLKEVISTELACDKASVIQELYSSEMLYDEYHPSGMFGDKVVPKELEIVLDSNPVESYFHTKATWHKKQKLSDL